MKDSADKNTIDAFQDAPLGWGGKRSGAGRKATGIVKKSTVIRIPDDMLPQVRALLACAETAQASQAAETESARAVLERWVAAAAGKENQPRWQNVCRLLSELQDAL